MPNINSLTYNGMKSTDLGVYVTGSGSFDAAEMDADKYEIAGRNGDLIIPKNRYKNIVVTYPAFIPKAFQEKAQSIRNWMRSAKAYARLEDTYDMEHYRLGLASGIQSFEPVNRNDASNFQLSFDCKPQRFLKTGETPLPIEPEAHSYSGEIVEFETVAVDDMTKAEVSLSPIQSLNGYDHPWAGGAGKNLLKTNDFSDYTNNGVTWHRNDDGSVVLNGTATARSYKYLNGGYYLKLEPGTYTASASGLESGDAFGNLSYGRTENGSYAGTFGTLGGTTPKRTFTVENTIYLGVLIDVPSGTTNSNRLIKVQIEEGSTATEWSPYSNICPITGHTGATLNVTGKNLFALNTAATSSAVISSVDADTGEVGIADVSTAQWVLPYFAYTDVKSGQEYTFSVDTLKYGRICGSTDPSVRPTNDVNIPPTDLGNNIAVVVNKNTLTRTFTSNYTGRIYWYYCTDNNIESHQAFTMKPMLRKSADDATFVPYDGASYPASFPQTVYGGTFDFVSGDGQSKMASAVFDGTVSNGWTRTAAYGSVTRFDKSISGLKPGSAVNLKCNQFPVGAIGTQNLACCNVHGNSPVLQIQVPTSLLASDNVSGLMTYFASNNLQVCYELATPIEIDLDPTEVETLLGLNNVWASDGTVEINYADPFNVDNPTYFEARPLFEITNPAQNDVLNVNGKTITFLSSYTGTVTIDCETMDCFSGNTNLNYLISATDFLVLNEGVNIVTWSGSGTCKMTPRWWEL